MMRLNQWWTPVLGVVALAIGVPAANAQPDPFNNPAGGGSAVTSSIRPISYQVPDQAGIGQAGIPSHHPVATQVDPAQYMKPWPGVSPFEQRYSRYENKNGMWSWENSNARRRYYGGVSAMFARLRAPNQTIVGDPDAFEKLTAANAGGVPLRIGTFSLGQRIFNFDFKTEGVRFNWGYWDADDTGVEMVGWYASDVFQEFKLQNGGVANSLGVSIPANNGSTNGVLLTFDTEYKIRYNQLMANGQITRIMRPMWEWNAFKIRPMWGARFTLLRERMNFFGLNSSGVVPPFDTQINNRITTYLAGPELGLHTSFGGDWMTVTLGTRVIMYLNHERQKISGFNVIDRARAGLLITNNTFFNDYRNTTHISPAFEQTAHLEARLFQYVPWLNRIPAIRDAKFRGGVTYLDIAEIARPAQGIKYNSWPLLPKVQTKRSKFTMFGWDIGIMFEY